MAESSDALSEIKKLRGEVDQQGEMLDAIVRYDPRVRDSILDEFKSDKVMSIIYLLIDGAKTQQQIIEGLKSFGIKGTSAPMVTRKIKVLSSQMRVITPVAKDGRSWVYAHNRLGRALSLTKNIRKMHSIDIQ